MLRNAWILWGIAGLVLLGLSIHRGDVETPTVANDGAAEEPDVSASAQEQAIQALSKLGYGKPVWIQGRETGSVDTSPPERIAIQAKPADTSNADLAFQDIASTRPDGSQLLLRAVVLFNRYSWMKGKDHVFQGESPQGIFPRTAISNADIEYDVRNSIATYCVGLASTEYKTDQAQTNTELSDNRAIRLCSTLFGLGYIDPASSIQRSMAIGLGERIAERDDSVPPSRQRAAVLIGVSEIGDSHTEADVADAIVHGLTAAGLRLSRYSRADGNAFRIFEVTSADYHDSTSDAWHFGEDLLNRVVLNQEDAGD
ncbi:MAG: hypothetical protein AAFY15_08380 [Cyanobacteria bacterium J06648_11]